MLLPQLRRVRWAVRATLVLGVAASVAANILHALPNPISQVIAAWPPLALLLTVELISRVPVHRRSLAAVRLGATSAIAGIAAWVSYWHMAGVAARYGETGASPYLLPLSVDGLVIVASVSLVELAGRVRIAEKAAEAVREADAIRTAEATRTVEATRTAWAARAAAETAVTAEAGYAGTVGTVPAPDPTTVAAQRNAPIAATAAGPTATATGTDRPGAAHAGTAANAGAANGADVRRAPASAAAARSAQEATEPTASVGGAAEPVSTYGAHALGSTVRAGLNGSRSKAIGDDGATSVTHPATVTPKRAGRATGSPAKRPAKQAAPKARRPVAETAALAAKLEAERPDLTPADIAKRLGVTTDRLRRIKREVALETPAQDRVDASVAELPAPLETERIAA